RGVAAQEVLARGRAVNQKLDVSVARGPGVAEQLAAGLLELLGQAVAQEVERRAQRRAPALVPAFGRARVAAAVARPAPQPVRAAPGRALAARPAPELDFPFRLVPFEELAIVRHPQVPPRRLLFQRVGDAAVAPAEVVAVTLA